MDSKFSRKPATKSYIFGEEKSKWSKVKSGIPQGSVLGPILFIIFINDLPDCAKNLLKIFADDTKIFKVIETMQDKNELQEDLTNLAKWAKKWQLPFNEVKSVFTLWKK